MYLYIITDCDAAPADRAGRQMSRVGLDAIFYTCSERGKSTAEAILKYQDSDCRCELLDSLCDLDREKTAAFMGVPIEGLVGMKRVVLVVPADAFGKHLGPALMHVSDRSKNEGVQFASTEGTISLFDAKKHDQVDITGYFINSSMHLKVSDIETIKDLPLSEN